MATNPSLFGMLGDEAAMQRQLEEQRAMQFANMSQEQRLAGMGYKAGSGLGRGVASLFGVDTVDPVVRQASQVRQLASQFDTTNPEGMMQFAQAVRGINPDLAVKAAQQAQQLSLTSAQAGKARAEEVKTVYGIQQEEKLRQALAGLPAEATDKDVEAIVRQFGNPDKIFSTIEKRQTAELNRQAKADLEREKAEERARIERDRQEFRQTMAQLSAQQKAATSDMQRQMIQLRIDDLKTKQNEKQEAKSLKQEAALNHAGKVITDVQEATGLVGGMTTGLVGKAQSLVPGTDAYNLNQRLLTIKANLGFDRLQQMRDASPTGGALGQVAVQELNALQSTVGSLEIGQDRKELAKNLEKIEHHYNNWIRTTQGAKPISLEEYRKTKQPMETAPAAGGSWSIRPKQ